MKLVTVAEMRALEQAAFAAGTSEADLQEQAGLGVARVVAATLGGPDRGPVVVLAGPGNNGRDGFVAARYLLQWGYAVRLYLGPRHSLSPREIASLLDRGAPVLEHQDAPLLDRLRAWLRSATCAVDALLGIGVKGPPRPPLDEMIATVNAVRAEHPSLWTVAVDVPSGVDADSGDVPGVAVRADATAVLGGLKTGLLRFPGAEFAGDLHLVPLAIPPEAEERLPVAVLDADVARAALPARPRSGHKWSFGAVLVVAGSEQYLGAPYLAGAGAARSGCGLVVFAATPRRQAVLAGLLPEATYAPLPDDDVAGAPDAALERLLPFTERVHAVLIGPGLGRSPAVTSFVVRFLEALAVRRPALPVVVDADGLYALSEVDGWWDRVASPLVLTPHHGEMQRLTGAPREEIARSPWDVALRAARRWRQVVVLKGPFTVIAEPRGQGWVLPAANPALATGGTGDVLAGLVAGLLAQSASPVAAAQAAVFVHSQSARHLLVERRWDTLLAGDLLTAIPIVTAALRRDAPLFPRS